MTHKTRTAVFYLLLILFFIVGAAVILYAQGWRLVTPLRAEKVGAIFVRSFPGSAAISLDGKPVQNQSGFLSNGTLISNLAPAAYQLTLTAPGYDDWHENANVSSTFVTKFNDAVLVPKAGTPAVSSTAQTFTVIGGEAIYENATGTVIWRGKAIGKGAVIGASTNLNEVILGNPSAEGNAAIFNFTKGTTLSLGPFFAKSGIAAKNIASVSIDPYDATQAIAQSAANIWMIDLAKNTVTNIAHASSGVALGSAAAESQSSIAWSAFANGKTSIAVYDKFSGTIAESSGTIAGKNILMKWLDSNLIGALQNDGALYLYHTDSQTIQKLASSTEDFAISDDGSLIAALESGGIELFPQKNNASYERLTIPDATSATGITWYKDSDHLFVTYPDHVSFLSIDDTSLINFTTVGTGRSPSYDPQANALYLIDASGALGRFDFPG